MIRGSFQSNSGLVFDVYFWQRRAVLNGKLRAIRFGPGMGLGGGHPPVFIQFQGFKQYRSHRTIAQLRSVSGYCKKGTCRPLAPRLAQADPTDRISGGGIVHRQKSMSVRADLNVFSSIPAFCSLAGSKLFISLITLPNGAPVWYQSVHEVWR